MVKEAKELVQNGVVGNMRKVIVEYSQGYLTPERNKIKENATLLSIGTHAFHLLTYITGLQLEELCADTTTFIPGRKVEDDANILLRFKGGTKGVLIASQCSTGEGNNITLRVFGELASLKWQQEDPNILTVRYRNKPAQTYVRGQDYVSEVSRHNTRVPANHPEGYLEGFANIYVNFTNTVASRILKQEPTIFDLDFPTIEDGLAGVTFRELALESSKTRSWVKFST